MKRVAIVSMMAAAVAVLAPGYALAQQRGAGPAPAAAAASEPAPRAADGKPDLSGVWWTGGDVGGRGFNSSGRGQGGGRGAGATAPPTWTALYTPAAAAEAKKLADKDDPTLKCIPTAFGTLNVSMFDVGAVAQIVQTPKFVVFLTETFHGFRLVPTDGRPFREEVPPSYRGDSVGRWEGDVFVVETKNFSDLSQHWPQDRFAQEFRTPTTSMHLLERFTRTAEDAIDYESTITDPSKFTQPFTVAFPLLKSPTEHIFLEYACHEANYGMLHLLSQARNLEKRHGKGRASR